KQQINIQTLSNYKSDIEVLKSKIDGNNDNIKRIQSEIEELNVKYDEIEKSVMGEEDGFNKLKNKQESLNEEVKELEHKLLDFDRESAKGNEDIDNINTEIIESMNNVANIRSKIGNFKALIQSFAERAETVKKELSDKKSDIDRLCANVDDLQKNYDQMHKELSDEKNKLDAERTEYLITVSDCNKAEEDLQNAKNMLQQAVSRQKLLKDMEKSFDNDRRSVKAVMNEYSNGNLKGVKLYGTVASLVSVDKEYSTAIEVALGGSAQYIVTETEEDAKKSIEFLKRTKQGRATFLPVSAAKNSIFNEKGVENCKGYLGIASDLINYDKKYNTVISGLLGKVVVVDNVDNAVAISRKYFYKFRVVTLNGELLAPGGSMSGGSRNNTNGFFARSNEIVELDKTIKDLTSKVDALEKSYTELTSVSEQKKNIVEELQNKVSEKNNDIIKIQSDLTHSKAFTDSLLEGQNAMNNELAQLDVQVTDMEKQIEIHNAEIDTANSKISALEKEIEQKRERLGIDLKAREEIVEKIGDIKIELNTVMKDVEMYNQRIAMVNLRKQEITVNISQKEKNIEEIKSVNDDINDDIDFKTEQINSINEEISSLNEIIKNSEDARKEAQESIKKQQELNKKLRDNQLVVQQEQSRIESKKTKTDVELEKIINKLWEDYELTITTAEELRTEIPDNAVRQINEIKAEIKGLGNINIDAIEEYNQVGERYEFLKTQRDDLVEAQNNLQQVIEDMVMIMKQQFSEKFAIINKHFGNTFVQLFGGGKAELVLTEPKDVLNSGVEINVQPPGKAVKSMMQLSGGEQAFVSIALLFAILKVRPAPFCVLDEIEAALDDVNVIRFADYLKKFSNDSQFIVVTHRRGTMEAANILYGVTMQEQGVSRLLSLNIDDVVDMNIG
ncbi:MAG: chromosome segregation protein SMC, partial [Clostridia bacterium]|nr:chromosome segregation protein SMC [Clostridia bacterium]